MQYSYSVVSSTGKSRLTSITYPNGRVLYFNYNDQYGTQGLDDTISRLYSLSDTVPSDDSGILEAYTYMGTGTVVARLHPQTNVNLTYIGGGTADAGDSVTGLDRFGRVVDQLWENTSTLTPTDEFQYAYDRDGNRLYSNNMVAPNFSELYHANGASETMLTTTSINCKHSRGALCRPAAARWIRCWPAT